VTEGELVVSIDGSDMMLAQGDAIFFEAQVEHAFDNRTQQPCGYYMIISRTRP